MSTAMSKDEFWTKERRQKQSEQMSKSMKKRWEKIKGSPASIAQYSRESSLYVHKGHPLALWMTDDLVGLTQKALGELIGVTEICVSNWTSGRSLPRKSSVDKLKIIAQNYPVPLDMSWAE